MDKDERYNARKHSERRNMITISIVAALFFICSIVIFATKYRNTAGEWFAVAADENGKNGNNTEIETSDIDITETTTAEEKIDITEVTTENDTEATTEAESADSTTEATTETATEAATEAEPVDISEYVNITDPDLSSKADDWYNEDMYIPGNVTDDKFFDSAVIIGDSRTEGLSLYTGMSNLDAFYSKGLNIEKVMTDEVVTTDDGSMITVLDALKLKEYKSIYISFGINELGWVYDYLFIDAYKTFIEEVRAIEPGATIYVENILPVSAELSKEDDIYNNPNIENFNKLLKEMCEEDGDIIYLDVASSVAVDGVLPADASTDGRHCNKDYCEKWLNYIRENVYIRSDK
jgi:hypothetical protein